MVSGHGPLLRPASRYGCRALTSVQEQNLRRNEIPGGEVVQDHFLYKVPGVGGTLPNGLANQVTLLRRNLRAKVSWISNKQTKYKKRVGDEWRGCAGELSVQGMGSRGNITENGLANQVKPYSATERTRNWNK